MGVDAAAALRGEPYLFPELGTNVCAHIEVGTDGDIFDGCEVVATGRLISQRMAPSPLEPRSSAAVVDGDGRLHVWLATQTPHGDRDGLAGALGLEPEQVRVIARDVGGGFGAKTLSTEDILVGWLARETGRPVRWTESRSESMLAIGHCRGQTMDFTIGGTRDGKVEAYRLEVLHEAGAYPSVGAFLPVLTQWMQSGVYAIPKLAYESNSVVTNTASPRLRFTTRAPWSTTHLMPPITSWGSAEAPWNTLATTSWAPGATPAMPFPLSLSAAAMPETCVPWPKSS